MQSTLEMLRRKLLGLTLILFLIAVPIIAQEIEDEAEEENESDIGEAMGEVTLILMGFGAGYVILRRMFVVSKMLDKEKYGKLQEMMLNIFRRFRKPLLWIHNITLLSATVTAGIHGVAFAGSSLTVVMGTLAWVFMLILSTSGMIMFYRFRPFWDNKTSKRMIRYLHRQWLFTVCMLIFLAIHLGMG